jgi:lysophospholipase L1-like esterase
MPLGDSLTAFPESYRGPLFRNLQAVGLDVDFVGSVRWDPVTGGDPDSEGHGGFTIGPDDRVDSTGAMKANLADNLAKWIPDAAPDVILLTIGTNDLAGGGAWITDAPAKFRNLVGQIQRLAPSAMVVLGDVPPSTYDPQASTSTVGINTVARQLGAADPKDRLVYGNTAQELLRAGFRADRDLGDGVHFTPAGGELFAKAWEPSLAQALAELPPLC